ncbi:Uncharacterized membrane protein [Austwickia chelonae]|uniref:DUF1648 domain-containing protein n=1 Tax=Austwickia chelonae NBRC 105200 TaxID=1184607 RepID=K6VRI7_9MICO|nr:DUF1648 domain-containing protein [Austwickia chelonae]GAB79379.1 hypothetical protein AUCHE_24_00340 [Austwickia chelonae NBRC 105200]SEW43713.1 Uncharacterized membrane protein [Austwickia chelonae]
MTLWLLLPLTAVVALGRTMYLLPSRTADTIPLGVRVPNTHTGHQVIRDAIATYRRRVLVITALTTVLVAAVSAALDRAGGQLRPTGVGVLALGAIVLMTVAAGVTMSRCAAPIRHAKDEQGWYDSVHVGLVASPDPEEPSSDVPWAWHAAAALILAGTAAYGATTYDSMPAAVVTHTGMDGPDSWADKSFWSVFSPLLLGAALAGMMLAFAVPLARRPLPPLPAGDIERARAIARAKAGATQKGLALSAVSAAAVFSLLSIGTWTEAAWTTPAVLLTAMGSTPVILITIMLSHPLAHENTPRAQGAGGPESPDGDRYWKWGFYNNPDDPRIMVDGRTGLGSDLNLGHPFGRLITIAGVAVLVGGVALPILAWLGG